MRKRDNDGESPDLRPKVLRPTELRPPAARPDPVLDPASLAAAVAGRTDALRGSDVIGLQRAVGNSGVGAMLRDGAAPGEDEERSPVHDVVASGGGTPLATDVREDMEAQLGHDFSGVRVHTDSAAHESAKSVQAHAYTVGENIVFQQDKYAPDTIAGRTMLAHELTHVVQQSQGQVDGSPAPGGIRVSDPGDRFEREAAATAERVISEPAAPAPVTATTSSGPAVQRDEAEEEEATAQGSFVQRDAVVQRQDEAEEEEESQS